MFRKMLLGLALFLGVNMGARGQYDLDHFYIMGRQALSDGRYSTAIENFNILSRLDTTVFEAYFYRGIAKYNLGDYAGAHRDFDRTLQVNPIFTPAYHYRAITLSQEGRYEDALRDLAEAVDLRPGYTDVYFSRGVTYFLSQQFDKAIADFNTFIKREPRESAAYLNRGACYIYVGDTTKALEDYNKAISLNRYDSEGYVRRSRVYALKEDYPTAIEDLDVSIRLDSTNTYAFFNRALLKAEIKDFEGALHDLGKVLEEEPGNALTLYNRALIRSQLEDFSGALEDYDRVLDINPNNVLAIFNRGGVFLEMGRYRNAVDDYSRAIELYPDFAKAYINRAYARNMLGQYRSSQQDYDTAQKKIREYQAQTSNEDGYAAFADTTRQYNHLLDFDADFAKKDFDNELLQYRDVDIRLKPLYRFVPSQDQEGNVALARRFESEGFDRMFAQSPVSLKFTASQTAPDISAVGLDARIGALANQGESGMMFFAKALLETVGRQYNSALSSYDKAVEKEPDNAFYYLNRGVLQAQMIDFIASIENNVQVLTIDNTNTTRTRVQDQVTHSYDYSAAIGDMAVAVNLDPSFPYAYYNLGNLFCLSNDLLEAINQYTKAIEKYPYLGEAFYNRGLVQIYLKDSEKGCMDLSTAGELGIDDAYGVIKKYCKTEEN